MKKALLLLALSALMVPAFVACNKDDKTDVTQKELPAPKYQEQAQKLTFSEGSKYESIELTESGRFIAVLRSNPSSVQTKASDPIVITGTYTVNGKTYKLEGIGDMTVEEGASGSNVTVTIDGDTVTATVEEPKDDPLYRTWAIAQARFKVTGSGLGDAGVSYTTKNGCNLEEVADYLKDNGVNFDETEYAGYNVKTITISGCGGFLVEFTGVNPYVGESIFSGSAFSYDLNVQGGSNLFNVKGNGTVAYDSGYCVLTLMNKISGNSNEYSAVVTFWLKEA